ncbi:MAG: hypothetical protein ACYTFM_06970, partial [Planctomycetota bacterium]
MQKTTETKLNSSQLHKLDQFGHRINNVGANFMIFDNTGKLIQHWEGELFTSYPDMLMQYSLSALQQESILCDKGSIVRRYGVNENILTVVLKTNMQASAVAVIDLSGDCFAGHTGSEVNKKSNVLLSVFSEMLDFFAQGFNSESKAIDEQIELVSTELAQVYEELVLLHKLSTNMHLTEADGNFLQMSCDSLTDIINVEGIAILLKKTVDGQNHLNLAAGSGLIDIDELTAAVLHDRLLEEIQNGEE